MSKQRALVDRGANVALVARQLRQGGDVIKLGQAPRRHPTAWARRRHGCRQLGEDVLLDGERAFGCRGDAPLGLGELGGGEAHRVGHGLAVAERVEQRRLGERLGVRLRHLDEVAEDVVVADLERLDAGLVDVAGFERGHDAAAVVAQLAGFVEGGAEAFADEAAVAAQVRRVVDQSCGEKCQQLAAGLAEPAADALDIRGKAYGVMLARQQPGASPGSVEAREPRAARSRGPPRPNASRDTARAISGDPLSAARTSSRS